MPKTLEQLPAHETKRRVPPTFQSDDEGDVSIVCSVPDQLQNLYGTKSSEAADGIVKSALNALGRTGEELRPFMVALAAELEPEDAIEAMLITQMAATHAAMTKASQKSIDAGMPAARESYDRCMNRLARTYIAQMEALKKYRAKAQQIVRVERVTVNEGGQAIVGDVNHRGRVDDKI